MKTEKTCCQCGATRKLTNLYGHDFCGRCESKLRLFADDTILKNAEKHAANKPNSYEEEVVERLQHIELNYIKAKVKLMHILERLGELT